MTPKIIAHRGLHVVQRENTLAAIEAALALGVHGVEVDARSTADGVVVLHHDESITSEGGDDLGAVAEMSYVELQTRTTAAGLAVATLRDALTLCRQRAHLFVEIKGSGMEELVTTSIVRSGSQASVHAFDHRVVAKCAALHPTITYGILQTSRLVDTVSAARDANAHAVWQHHDLLDRDLVQELHGAELQVVAWTVNDAGRARELSVWGVDAICTDFPEQVRVALV